MTVGNRAQVKMQGIGNWGILNDVQHVPNLLRSMIAIPALDQDGKYVIFGGGKCIIVQDSPTIYGSPLMTAELTSRSLYEFNPKDITPATLSDEISQQSHEKK